MKSKISLFITIISLIGFLGACKDTPKKTTSSHTTKTTPKEANNDIEKIEHEEDDEKITQKVDNLIDSENKLEKLNENDGPVQPQNNPTILQNWTNHQDNLSSPLNRNY
ncbi:hypothetical protein [Helicobacter cetorum]|uniref:hypothetical protein n=1 Tax=Helicobacter cetorum TaxID=138563 RepID=UPI000CF076E4|nr:hypothetical protein [Helicobacter cetorum]